MLCFTPFDNILWGIFMTKSFPKIYSTFSIDFVSPLFPKRGEEVKISIVSSEKLDSIILKYDGQTGLVFNKELKEDGRYNSLIKYSISVPTTLDDELFHYYFAFFVGDKSFYYSKKGVTRYTPNTDDRFSLVLDLDAPDWVASATCYQIFPDRFCNADPTLGAKNGEYEFDGGKVTTPNWYDKPKPWEYSRCCDFYNGDLKGIESKAKYLKALGVSCVYLNPIFSSQSVHRYDTIDFFQVDEKLGGNIALAELTNTFHKEGIRVVLDISINHTGLEATWLKKALKDENSDEREFYYFNQDGSLGCWQDVKTLPQLNYSSKKLRALMYKNKDSVMQKFLLPPYSIDGWRLDVAPEVGRRGNSQLCKDVWREVRESLKKTKKDLYLVGEDWDDSKEYISGDMWDATMNYYGSGRILRSWMGERDRFLEKAWGHNPEKEEPWDAEETVNALNEALFDLPGQVPFFSMNLFDSHDTPRLHNDKQVFDREIYKGVVLALYFLPGMPNIYYGDEILLDGELGSNEGARYPMEWREENWDKDMLSLYREIGKIREEKSFSYDSINIIPLDSMAFAIERIREDKAYIAVINRGEERTISLSSFLLPQGNAKVILGEASITKEEDYLIRVKDKKSIVIAIE